MDRRGRRSAPDSWPEDGFAEELGWVDILGGQLYRGRLAADGGLDQVRTIADRSGTSARSRPSWEADTCSLRAWGFLFVDEAGSVRELAQPEAGRTEARTNDGDLRPTGRFWAVVRNTNFRLRPHAAREMLARI